MGSQARFQSLLGACLLSLPRELFVLTDMSCAESAEEVSSIPPKQPICMSVYSIMSSLSFGLQTFVSRFTVFRDADLMDFINAPIGKGLPITQTLRPLIAVPTTAGTGSETTGTAILDITSRSFKTGIASRAMKPVLGIVVKLNGLA